MREMLDLYNEKYDDGSELLVLKSLSYFIDAEKDEPPVILHAVDWNTIKTYVAKQLEDIR